MTVNAINDAPVLSSIDNQIIEEDGSLELAVLASDVDEDILYYGAEVDGNALFK